MPDNDQPTLAIVGAGAFATYVLERLAARLQAMPLKRRPSIHIYNSSPRFGGGMAQDWDQSNSSLMNRVAAQICFAADESCIDCSPFLDVDDRPDFLGWANTRFSETRDARYLFQPRDIPPRAVHGEALGDAFARYEAILTNAGADIRRQVEEIQDLEPQEDGRIAIIGNSAVVSVYADAVILATGHPDNLPKLGTLEAHLADWSESHSLDYIHSVYPLKLNLTHERAKPGSHVGIIGMGLTALDCILYLTEGRGGTFVRNRYGDLNYNPSGNEPLSIIPFSRSGIFVEARPVNHKVAQEPGGASEGSEHKGVYLTAQAIDQLRRTCGLPITIGNEEVRQLDFAAHIVPLVVLEMVLINERVKTGVADLGPKVAAAYIQFLNSPPTSQAEGIELLLKSAPKFDWRALFDPLNASLLGLSDWGARLRRYIKTDINNAREGNLRNPYKAACDGTWRDLRHELCMVMDRGGLTAQSQAEFHNSYLRHYSRMSNGFSLSAAEKLLALIDVGLVDPGVGPDPRISLSNLGFAIEGRGSTESRIVSTVVNGRTHDFDIDSDRRPLYRNIAKRGIVRAWQNPGMRGEQSYEPGCLDLDESLQPVGREGRSDRRIWVIGAPVERLVYFHLSAARPKVNSSILRQADVAASGALSILKDRAEASHAR